MMNTMTQPIRVLSLGAGVQSTTLLLMSWLGDLPPFDHVIFADTGWEPDAVYDHLGRLHAEAARHGQTIDVVSAGNIRDDHVDPTAAHLFIRNPVKHPEWLGRQRSTIPFFVTNPPTDANRSGDGKLRRTCTRTYKIEPVERRIRAILGIPYRGRWPLHHVVDQTLGISWDEATRMRVSDRPAIVYQYPLIDGRIVRDECHTYMAAHGWTAPRSACIGCPFHRNDEWRRLRDDDPAAWADAIEFDATFRQRVLDGLTTNYGVPYLHDSRVPLAEADIDHDKPAATQLSLMADTTFGAECEGLCGT